MNRPLTNTLMLLTITMLVSACTGLWQAYAGGERRGVSSSLVEYLYPDGDEPPPITETIPRLKLPIRVGIAFVPSSTQTEMTFLSLAIQARTLDCVKIV